VKKLKKVFFIITVSVGAIFSAGAGAATVIIDFDAATPGSLLSGNYVEDGFTMESLSGHYDFYASGGTSNSPYLGLDVVEAETLSKVRFTGGTFNLVSLDVMYAASEIIGENQILESSAGGLMQLNTAGVQNFTGSSWSNLTWITLSSNVNIAGPGFDTITFDTVVVPIPAAMLLFGSGLAGLFGIARRRRDYRAAGERTPVRS
jgi:hypothetical protein